VAEIPFGGKNCKLLIVEMWGLASLIVSIFKMSSYRVGGRKFPYRCFA
jgi:hypothetical protein